MSRLRVIGWSLLALSVLALAAALAAMAIRLIQHQPHETRPTVWFQEPITSMQTYIVRREPHGQSSLPLRFEVLEHHAADPQDDVLRLHWRGQTYDLPTLGRDDPRLPGLLRFNDWLRVVQMVQAVDLSQTELQQAVYAGKLQPRLLVAARYPAAGFNPGSWGLVRRQDWPYRFIELKKQGPAADSIEVTQRTYRQLEDTFFPGPHSDPVQISQAARQATYWQHEAMLLVTPATLYRARNKQVQASMRPLGWTWPVAGVAVMGIMLGATLIGVARLER